MCIIPGTAAVAGITRMDEPVGELLDRFEQAAIDEALAAGVEPKAVTSRRLGRPDVTGPLAVVLDAADVQWAGRTTTNPVHRIAEPSEWLVQDGPESRRATHSSTGARLHVNGGPGDEQVVLSVPVSGAWVDIPFILPPNTIDGGIPVVSTEDATTAMRAVLAIAAGVDGPDLLPAVTDFLLWYAKDKKNVKYRQLYRGKEVGGLGGEQYTWVENDAGEETCFERAK